MNDFKLTIPKPCTENWKAFTPTSTGGFCENCQKNVIDFTKMSEKEIIDFFKNKPAHTCGRFNPAQLKIYEKEILEKPQSKYQLLKAGFLSLLLMGGGKELMAQQQRSKTNIEQSIHNNHQDKSTQETEEKGITVEGTVISKEDNSLFPGVSVIIKGTSLGTQTDINGKFKLQNLKEGDVLIFMYIGCVTQNIMVDGDLSQNIIITMRYDSCELLGEVAVEGLYESKKQSGFSKFFSGITQIFK
ncbi:MAG: hypothetical protein F6K11_29930 [Leptolyngbya sp. SIO3F4]|nr:hypothetical protein [Leptolyngbya sp. SIO3F4]